MVDITRKCYGCKQTKPIIEFPKKHDSKYGRAYKCNHCSRVDSAQWRIDHPDYGKQTNKLWRKSNPELEKQVIIRSRYKLKRQVLTHYSKGEPKCNCCGESDIDFLTIDHINDDGSKYRKSEDTGGLSNFYRWIRNNKYPDNLQVLCWNCNCAKKNGVCPHKRSISREQENLNFFETLPKKLSPRFILVKDFLSENSDKWFSRVEIQKSINLMSYSKQYIRSILNSLIEAKIIEFNKLSLSNVKYRISLGDNNL